MRSGKGQRVVPGDTSLIGARPLAALLSQVLVAFTIEFDNEFERRMSEAGDPGALLSLVVWSNLMRFVAAREGSVRDLAAQALASEKLIQFELGCLERWRFVKLRADASDTRPIPTREHRRAGRILRDGWGSGRGIRSGWIVCLTGRGLQACEIWPPLCGEIERRWQARFGADQIASLRQALEDVVDQLDVELPDGLPGHWQAGEVYPARGPRRAGPLALPVLLAQVLLAFRIEFERESRAPLALCANTLRVLGEQPVPVGDIPRLTGCSPETGGIGWQIKPYIVVEPGPSASRGKMVRLSPRGLKTRQMYHERIEEMGTRWGARFGKNAIHGLRESLLELFLPRSGERLLLAEGLVPAEGTVRAGKQAPALGRHDIGAAARQRMRDLVAQTDMFVRDPAGTLPHYPLWDMNRGFGP